MKLEHFKVGMRVKCVGAMDGEKSMIGLCGVVREVASYSSRPILVEFSEYTTGMHSNNGRYLSGCCRWGEINSVECLEELSFADKYENL